MEETTKYIVFKLKKQSFGVNVKQVLSIEKLQEITEVPKTPAFIKGIFQLRGETTPVIDLKERLHMEETKLTEQNRILIVIIDGMQVGFIVDSATEVMDVDSTVIEPTPKMISEINGSFIKGVAKLDKGLLILLDLETILDINETLEVKEVINE